MIVLVLFGFSYAVQDDVDALSDNPDVTIEVQGFQWQWQFHYRDEDVTVTGVPDRRPVMVLPVNETVRLVLTSRDVIHSFYVPDFLFKRDVIPTVKNQFDLEVEKAGTYRGLLRRVLRAQPRAHDVHRSRGEQGRVSTTGWRSSRDHHRRPSRAPAPPEPAREPSGLLRVAHDDRSQADRAQLHLHRRSGSSASAACSRWSSARNSRSPNEHLVDPQTYNEFFTMHGSIMIYLFAVPFAFGLANYIVPLQIGAPDMAFPRLNALGYWLYLFGGITMISGFLTAGGSASFGWFAYAPLSGAVYSPGVGADLWIVGVVVTSTAGVLTAVNIVTTIFMLRAPGMTMFRMPIYTWNMLVTSMLVLLAFPVLTAALAMLFCDRHLDTHIFEATSDGTPILWQHMFWFFGHPEVYIIALPFFGVVTEVFAVFSRRPVFGYKSLVFATLAIGGLSVGVWAHHMYATGVVLLPFFTVMSMLIAVPTGIKFFNWIGTMYGGRISFKTPMLFAIGMLLVFLIGGLSGVLQAMAPVDFSLTDTYFVVAHMHYVIMGVVMGAFAGVYYWFPKMTGKMLSEKWGKVHFWAFFIGINLTFFVQHQLGLDGMPRRVATYTESRRLGHAEPDLHDRVVHPRDRRARRSSGTCSARCGKGAPAGADPVGRPDARVGDHVAAAGAQLRLAAADPLRAPACGTCTRPSAEAAPTATDGTVER